MKIIGFYIFSALCLALFFYIDNSSDLKEHLEKTDRFRTDWGFGFYAIIGIIKLASLIVGITIPIILTIMIIREKIKSTT